MPLIAINIGTGMKRKRVAGLISEESIKHYADECGTCGGCRKELGLYRAVAVGL